jgi:hypothetical protein
MSSSSKQASGKCLCGEVQYIGRGNPCDMHVCHCRSCARWGGGPAFGLGFSEGVEFSGPVTWFNSSEWAERGFCSKCGSTIFYRLKNADLFVGAGTLDDQTIVPQISSHIYVDTKPHYYEFADSAPRLTEEEFLASLKESEKGKIENS